MPTKPNTSPEESREIAPPVGTKAWHDFVERARSGDPSTLPLLRRLVQEPEALLVFGGDLAQQAEMAFIEAAAGKNLAFKEALTHKLGLLRAELAGPNPTPIERLLVERVVACWLQVQDSDIRYAQAKNLHLAWAEYHQRRMDRAHRRYLSALKALALIRKLAVPVLQVNIADKQVNVAGACLPPQGEGPACLPRPE